MKISATIITLNEERNIERCIRSLLPVVDEIVVLDAFSADRTVQMAKDLGAKVIQHEWLGYAASKNLLNEHASFETIFSMDADEALDADLQQSISELKTLPTLDAVYSVNRLTNYCGQWIYHSGWYPDVKVRIFPKSFAWSGEYVHEVLEIPEGWEEKLLPGHLEHYSYYNFKEHRERADKYSRLTALKHFKAGKRASVLKPIFSGIGRFVAMYFFKKGFLDGKMGFKIAWISAQSNIYKYQELRRLQSE